MFSPKKTKNNPDPKSPPTEKAVFDLIGLLGKVINSSTLYGPNHRMTEVAHDEAYQALSSVLQNRARLRISLFEGTLHVDGNPLERSGALVQVVVRQMKKLDVSGFSLLRGMTREDFDSLMQMLSAREAPSGEDFNEQLRRRGVQHVQSETKGELTRLGEDETVVGRREAQRAAAQAKSDKKDAADTSTEQESEAFLRNLAAGMSGASNQPGGGSGGEGTSGGERGEKGPDVEKILAFLKGSDSLSSIPSSAELQQVASDSEKLANLIMESTTVQQRNQEMASGESLADLVVGALRRTYNGLRRPVSDPSRQLDARKSLLMLEKNVLDRLHKMMEGVDNMEAQVPDDFGEEVDELEVATMTSEYVRRRESLERMEKEVMSYIKGSSSRAQQDDRLQSAFQEAGLPESGWRELVAKSGAGGSPGGGADLGALTMLLSQLDRLMEGGQPDPKSVGETVKEVGSQVSSLTEATKDKMNELGETLDQAETDVSEAQAAGKRPPQKLAGRELLAEIVQELCQPATAISCSAMMLQEGMFGPLPPDQADVMQTVADCGDKLNRLLEHLKNIVGYPSDFIPKHDQV